MTAQAGDTLSLSFAADKTELRREARRRRQQLPRQQRQQAARRVALRLLALCELRAARNIAVYLATGSELPIDALIDTLLRKGHHVYAPAAAGNGRMRFLRLQRGDRLRRDGIGLPRPPRNRPQRHPRRFDLVLVPLVAFDAQAHRLGAGGGYYDRAFAFRRVLQGPPRLIGCAFEVQRLSKIPVEPWDLRLDAVVTERRLYRPRF